MKLIKTIEKIIKEAEEAYNVALDSVIDEKELERLEKNYQDSLKLMRTFNQIKTNNEFYVCPTYNEAIADEKIITIHEVKGMHGLGTPDDLNAFLQKSFV